MTSAAARMREYRDRQRAGKLVVPVTIDDGAVEVLEHARLLDPAHDHSREDIGRAIARLLDLLSRDG